MNYLIQFFSYEHLPKPLQKVSKPFHDLVNSPMVQDLPNSPEKTTMIRKLLEAKDCAVRSLIGDFETKESRK